MDNCLFCKIIKGEIPSQKVYEDEHVYAFKDIHPQAPVHVLVVSKVHVKDVLESAALKDEELAAMLRAAGEVAKISGISENGFRVVTNCGHDGCQSVPHLHFHVLGGALLTEKMA
jgi:histidine triad (HIT) family protein